MDTAITKTVPDLQERYDKAQESYETGVDILNKDIAEGNSGGRPITSYEIDLRMKGLKVDRDTVQAETINEYKRVIDSLDEAAKEGAKKIKATQDELLGADVPTDADGVFKYRKELATRLFNDIPLVDGQAEWEHAQEAAPKIADAMKDGDLTPDEIKTFRDKYGPLLSNPFVANALQEHLRPNQIVDFCMRVGYSPDVDRSVSREVLRQVGTGLTLATGGINADGSNAARHAALKAAKAGLMHDDGQHLTERARNFLEEFKEAGGALYNPWDYSDDPQAVHDPIQRGLSGYEVMLDAMGQAGKTNPDLALGPDFFETPSVEESISHDIIAWDASQSQARCKYLESVSFFGENSQVDVVLHSMFTLMDSPESLVGDAEGALKQVEQERISGVRKFLDSNVSEDVIHGPSAYEHGFKDGDLPIRMTRYLTGGRTTSGSQAYYGFPDGGEQFGKVVSEASNPDRIGLKAPSADKFAQGENDPAYKLAKKEFDEYKAEDLLRTRIASDFMLGYQDGLDVKHDLEDNVEGQDVFGHRNHRLRSWAGTIIAPHMGGLADSLQQEGTNESSDPVWKSGEHAEMNFSKRDSQRFMARGGIFEDLAFDAPAVIDEGDPSNPLDDKYKGGRRPALDTLRMSAHARYVADLNANVSNSKSLPRIADKWAPLMNSLYIAPADAETAVKEAMDKRNSVWEGGIGLVIDSIPFSKFIDEKWMNALKNGVPLAMDALGIESTAGSTEPAHSSQHTAAGKALSRGIYAALSLPAAWEKENGGRGFDWANPELADSGFVEEWTDEHGNTRKRLRSYADMTPEQRVAFEKWVRDVDGKAMAVDSVNRAHSEAEELRKKANVAIHGKE